MSEYTEHADAIFDPDTPILGSTHLEARDNLKAAREGSTGARYEQTAWHPYNGLNIGDGIDGAIYDAAIDGTVATIDAPTFEAGYSYGFLFEGLGQTASATLEVRLYGGGGFYDAVDLIIPSSPIPFNGGIAALYRPFMATKRHYLQFEGAVFTDHVDFQFDPLLLAAGPTAQSATSIRFQLGTGSFDAGKLIMLKRLDYA